VIQVALNGASTHPAMPRTSQQIAADAAASVAAGATLLHFHAFDDDGKESLAEGPVTRALRAVRAVCPGVPISMTTFADLEPDPVKRLATVASWTELPDLIPANQGEEGIEKLSELLLRRGVGVEACVLSVADGRCVRGGLEFGGVEQAPDASGDVAFEAPERFEFGFAFGLFAFGVGAGLRVVADAGESDDVDRAVELAVAS
jgi:hypothetical protein